MGKKFDFDFVPFTHDQIREMSEEDLYKNISAFKRRIKEALRAGKETQLYEVEFCYLDHERIMRERSRKIHDEFVRNRKRARGFNRRNSEQTAK